MGAQQSRKGLEAGRRACLELRRDVHHVTSAPSRKGSEETNSGAGGKEGRVQEASRRAGVCPGSQEDMYVLERKT